MITAPQSQNHNTDKGFTLVELLLVLALLGMVLAGIFQFFFFTNRTYADTDSMSQVIQETNLFISQIEREIRSASKPNDATKAVRVLNNGEQIDIYLYHSSDDKYERISYRLNPSNKTQLQRGSISAAASQSVPGTGSNPQYGAIPEDAWKTLVTNVANHSQNATLFTDISDDQYLTSERRHISIDLRILDPDSNRSVTVQTSAMSRSGRSKTSLIAAGGADAIPASNVIVLYNGSPITSIQTDWRGKTFSVIGKIEPLAATNRSIKWSNNRDWASFGRDTTKSTEVQTIQIKENKGRWVGFPGRYEASQPRDVTITVKSGDDKASTTFIIRQGGDG